MKCLKTECENRGCCYQDLDLEEGAPICHRKIPSLHDVNITYSDRTHLDFNLDPSYPAIATVWPPVLDQEQTLSDLRLQIRRFDKGHLAIKLYDNEIFDGYNFINQGNIGNDSDIKVENVTAEITSKNSPDDLRLMLKLSQDIHNPYNTEKRMLLDLSYGSVILTQNYSEISLLLPTYAIYGLGGHDLSFNYTGFSGSNFTKHLLYNVDPSINNGYQHSMPGFIVMGADKRFIGVHVDAGGSPLEIEAMPGAGLGFRKPMVVFRSMRGSAFIIHVFLGPTPKDIMSQMMSITGLNQVRMKNPPLWALGHHICRNTSNQEISFQKDIELLSNITLSNNTIPYDSDCIGISLMKTAFGINNNTYEEDDIPFEFLSEDFALLNKYKKAFLLHQPVQVEEGSAGLNKDVFIKSQLDDNLNFAANFTNMYKHSKMTRVVLPDFRHPETPTWYQQKLAMLTTWFNEQHDMIQNGLFGITLIKNSPLVYNDALMDTSGGYDNASFCNTSSTNLGPFVPKKEWKLENNSTYTIDDMDGKCSWNISGMIIDLPDCSKKYLDPTSRYNSSDIIGSQGTLCPLARNNVAKSITHISSHNTYALEHAKETASSFGSIANLNDAFIFSEHASTSIGKYGGILGSRHEFSWKGMKVSVHTWRMINYS